MGGCDFSTRAQGKTATEAFISAREEAAYENGHGGYTGTIAEKGEFRMVDALPGETSRDTVNRLADTAAYNNKWGPALCLDLGPVEGKPGIRTFLFFGVASS